MGRGDDFGAIRFGGTLRPSQVASSTIIKRKLDEGERRLLVVAPPGSGKTVLGLYVWTDLVRKPALVLSPNSAIQAQWVARAEELFELDGRESELSTVGKEPGILTSLTYQSVTMPQPRDEGLDPEAMELWVNDLIAKSEAEDEEQARAWILDLRDSNEDVFNERRSFYRKKVRDDLVAHGNALFVLHSSAKATLAALKDAGVGLIILDECHHLLHHWGKVLDEVRSFLGDPIVLGLTATPPDPTDVDEEDYARYTEFFGEVDYEVPVPALVRDANLAPYQDLAYFVRPSEPEIEYIAGVTDGFSELLVDLAKGPGPDAEKNRLPGLDDWLFDVLGSKRLPTGVAKSWEAFERRDSTLAEHARLYLHRKGRAMPPDVPGPGPALLATPMSETSLMIPLIDRYIRHGLMRSKSSADHALAETAKKQLMLYGIQVTQTGTRPCAAPVTRVLAYSEGKRMALKHILETEMQTLGDGIRAVIVTDFERTSSTALVENVLDDEAGGAIAVFRELLTSEAVDRLDPILMTGSTVLVDDDLVPRLLPRMKAWVDQEQLVVRFEDQVLNGYHRIRGIGKDWVPRNYTRMLTELFQEGVTKCIVGTRGLLGEGWDASRINVLVDLTTVTTHMSINQLRGRSFRLDKHWPEKVANNWDVVCVLPESNLGDSDFKRFKRKHKNLYGVCDDGAIEMGVGHVHPGLTEREADEVVAQSMGAVNEEMLVRSRNRDRTRGLWGIGEPWTGEAKQAIEVAKLGGGGGFPTNVSEPDPAWNEASLVMLIGKVVVESLQAANLIGAEAKVDGGDRGGSWSRLFLEGATVEEEALFVDSMREVLGPLDNPRYMLMRVARYFQTSLEPTLLSRLLPMFFDPKEVMLHRDQTAMWHAVPKALAKKRELADIFVRLWSIHVGPTRLVYGHSEGGRATVQQVLDANLGPTAEFHDKRVFT